PLFFLSPPPPTPGVSTLSLHDALPILATAPGYRNRGLIRAVLAMVHARGDGEGRPLSAITGIPYFYRQFGYEYVLDLGGGRTRGDRKSTRLNSSHRTISYAVFCLKKKK